MIRGLHITAVWQNGGFSAEFNGSSSIKLLYKTEHLCFDFRHYAKPQTVVSHFIRTLLKLKVIKTEQNSFEIKAATAADVEALAALHVTTFNETHGGFKAPTYETREWQWRKAFQDKDDSWFCFVIEKKDEGLIGFAKGQPYNHANHAEFSGELNKIYLLRKYHKLGLGRQLVCKVANEFVKRGINSMLLFGDANNPSNKFYEQMGAEKLFAKNGEFHGGYGWTDLKKLVANCKNV